jgi:hypothetical protein
MLRELRYNPIDVWGRYLFSDLMADPDYTFSATFTNSGPEVRVQANPEKPRPQERSITHGVFLFEPVHFTLRSAKYHFDVPKIANGDVDMQYGYELLNSVPVLARTEMNIKANDILQKRQSVVTRTLQYEFDLRIPDESEFTLEAFGLSETAKAAEAESRPIPTAFPYGAWFLGLGVVFVIVAFILFRRQARKEST